LEAFDLALNSQSPPYYDDSGETKRLHLF